jgi:TonB family protein
VETKKADILQVRKYLNGELDAKAMHRLEREALDDPFLMDALEGFETVPANPQANLADLSSRLQQRVAPPQKGRVIAWRAWSIAASVLLVLTIGGLWLKKTPTVQENKQLALNKAEDKATPANKAASADNTKVELKDTVAPKPPVGTPSALLANATQKHTIIKPGDKSVYQQEISADDNKTADPIVLKEVPVAEPVAQYKSENPALSEIVALNYNDKKADTLAMLAKKAKDKASIPLESKLQGKVDGVTTLTSRESNSGYSYNSISGIIRAKNDGSPVIGAAIRMQGTNKSTVTDANGFFAMPATIGKKTTLEIASIGYQPKQISAKSGDSLKVELNPSAGALSEVVTVGYGTKKNSDDEPVAVVSAHPQGSMSAFKKYLQANAVLPDSDVTGTVSVTFTVENDGTLSDFKIKKSLSPAADQKAIDLIKAGPTWIGNSNGSAEQVTVKVKFLKK